MTNTERIADAGKTMGRLTKHGHKFNMLNIMQGLNRYTEIDEIMNTLSAYESTNLTPSEIIAMQSELTRLHNMLSAVSNPSENIATYSDFIKASLEDGAKKMTSIDEQYTGSRPYCD